ncbi:hypothetical protein QJS10_CPB19g00665 [Acorus calamus]|uniref:Uncharacterized protein n=1 Tax=Acorus calamus TaxID=4465 RepID=A0AAV9CDS7_ACOCL|nr:hypothetical protein QJS10_CPB19g00665 [Acorus calamus]
MRTLREVDCEGPQISNSLPNKSTAEGWRTVCGGGSREDRVQFAFVEVDLKKIVSRVIERARVSKSVRARTFE